ncbi:MAG: hypothetical protein ACYTBJ_01175 [Planctomycetota bacterium]|jgi:hypothetical protein
MAKGKVETTVKILGTDVAAKKLKEVERAFDDVSGGAGALNRRLRDIGPKHAVAISGITAAFQALGGVVSLVTQAAQTAGQAFIALGQRGGDVSAIAQAFDRFGDTEVLSRLNAVSGGLLTNTELMAGYTQAMRAGIVSQEDFIGAIETTVRAAQDMGKNMTGSIQAVITAMSGGGMEGLGQLGVNVLEIRERLQNMGETMESTTGRAMAFEMALVQMREDMGRVSNSAGHLGDVWQQLYVIAKNFIDKVGQGFAENQQLMAFFQSFATALQESLPPANELAEIFVRMAASLIDLAQSVARAGMFITKLFNSMFTGYRILNMTNPLNWFAEPAHMQAISDFGAEAENAFELMSGSMDAAGESFAQMERDMDPDRIEEEVTQSVYSLGGALDDILGLPESIAIGFREWTRSTDDTRESVEGMIDPCTDLYEPLDNLRDPLQEVASGNTAIARSARSAATQIQAEARALAALAAVVEADEERDPLADFVAGSGRGGFDPAHERLGGGAPDAAAQRGGGGGPSAKEREYERQAIAMRLMFADMDQEAREFQGIVDEIGEQYNEELVQLRLITAELDEQERARQRNLDTAEEQKEEMLRQFQVSEQLAEAERKAADARHERLRGTMDVTAEGLDLVGSTIGDVVAYQEQQVENLRGAMEAAGASQAQIAKATKAQMEQIEKLKKIQGAFLIAYNVVMAAIEVAAAAKAFGDGEYIAGAMHIISAAAYGVAAGLAAAKLGGGGSTSTPAAPSGGRMEQRKKPDAPTETGKGEGVRIVNIYSLGRDKGEIGKAMEDAQWDRKKQAIPEGGVEGIEYDA